MKAKTRFIATRGVSMEQGVPRWRCPRPSGVRAGPRSTRSPSTRSPRRLPGSPLRHGSAAIAATRPDDGARHRSRASAPAHRSRRHLRARRTTSALLVRPDGRGARSCRGMPGSRPRHAAPRRRDHTSGDPGRGADCRGRPRICHRRRSGHRCARVRCWSDSRRRYHRRPRQPLRHRGQGPARRPGRHRPDRGPIRAGRDRRRGGRRRDRRIRSPWRRPSTTPTRACG